MQDLQAKEAKIEFWINAVSNREDGNKLFSSIWNEASFPNEYYQRIIDSIKEIDEDDLRYFLLNSTFLNKDIYNPNSCYLSSHIVMTSIAIFYKKALKKAFGNKEVVLLPIQSLDKDELNPLVCAAIYSKIETLEFISTSLSNYNLEENIQKTYEKIQLLRGFDQKDQNITSYKIITKQATSHTILYQNFNREKTFKRWKKWHQYFYKNKPLKDEDILSVLSYEKNSFNTTEKKQIKIINALKDLTSKRFYLNKDDAAFYINFIKTVQTFLPERLMNYSSVYCGNSDDQKLIAANLLTIDNKNYDFVINFIKNQSLGDQGLLFNYIFINKLNLPFDQLKSIYLNELFNTDKTLHAYDLYCLIYGLALKKSIIENRYICSLQSQHELETINFWYLQDSLLNFIEDIPESADLNPLNVFIEEREKTGCPYGHVAMIIDWLKMHDGINKSLEIKPSDVDLSISM